MKRIKRLVMRVWALLPFGYLARFQYGELTVTLYKTGWLDISDGDSHDMLPINMVSQQLVDECERQLELRGYAA